MSSLSISNLSAGYGQVRVIEDLSMNVQSGETVALLGTNGNGKSTLMRCVMGLLAPTAGSIKLEIDGITHELAGAQTEDIVALGVVMAEETQHDAPDRVRRVAAVCEHVVEGGKHAGVAAGVAPEGGEQVAKGLDGKADLFKNGKITVSSMETWIAERVKELTEGAQTPTVAKPQTVPDFPIGLRR